MNLHLDSESEDASVELKKKPKYANKAKTQTSGRAVARSSRGRTEVSESVDRSRPTRSSQRASSKQAADGNNIKISSWE